MAVEAAKTLGITVQNLYYHLGKAHIKAEKFNGVWLIRPADLAAFRPPGRGRRWKRPKKIAAEPQLPQEVMATPENLEKIPENSLQSVGDSV